MLKLKWANYDSLDPPVISPDFFNESSSLEDSYENPLFLIPLLLGTTRTETITDSLDSKDTTSSEEKKRKAKKIAKEKTKEDDVKVPSLFTSNEEFTKVMNALYRSELSKQGLNPNLATMLVAQDAIETSWGQSVKGKFNFGNITTNGDDWTTRTGNRKWKDFKSVQDYIQYKIKFLSNNRYLFFTYANMNNVTQSMLNLADRGYDPGNPQYGSRVAKTTNTVLKYLSNV